jgi:hypothetical protein
VSFEADACNDAGVILFSGAPGRAVRLLAAPDLKSIPVALPVVALKSFIKQEKTK